MKKYPKVFSFEGVDCSGKTTLINSIYEKLKEENLDVYKFKLPGDGIPEVGKLFLDKNKTYDNITYLLLTCADINEVFKREICTKSENSIILLDRFFDSTLIYQQVFNLIPEKDIKTVINLCCGDFKPIRTYVLDMNYNEYLERKKLRHDENDKFESDANFLYRFNSIMKLYYHLNTTDLYRFQFFDAILSKEKLVENVYKDIMYKLEKYNEDIYTNK